MDRFLRRVSSRSPLALLLALAVPAPPAGLAAQAAGPPPAEPADVASVDAIVAAVYDAIGGAAGEPRDWDRFRSLFAPGARLIPAGATPGGGYRHRVLTPEDYIERVGPQLVEGGFFEREIHRVEERFGPVVHGFSTYESRRSPDDAEPFARGVNSFQLFHDGERWWVVTIYWFGENEDHPIPAEYLPGG